MNEALGAFSGPAILALFIALILWDRHKSRKPDQQNGSVEDGPENEAYQIFTRQFDLMLSARDIPERLNAASLDGARGWTDRTGQDWQRTQNIAADFRGNSVPLSLNGAMPDGLAVTFLVDQSGSMKGPPIAAVAVALERVSEILLTAGSQVEILGFSSVGWQGGRAYRQWMEQGRTPRPGRLCALLHIIYKEAEASEWTAESRRIMLHPDILRENVDGEALRWAAERTRRLKAERRVLCILSDGAPVDDVTLMHNGPNYLERDLLRAIAEIETAGDIHLEAIGVNYAVGRYYAHSMPSSLDALSAKILQQVSILASG